MIEVYLLLADKLNYEDKYSFIESEMSPSNIGARKHKNIRNHLFVVYGVINSVLHEEMSCLTLCGWKIV